MFDTVSIGSNQALMDGLDDVRALLKEKEFVLALNSQCDSLHSTGFNYGKKKACLNTKKKDCWIPKIRRFKWPCT